MVCETSDTATPLNIVPAEVPFVYSDTIAVPFEERCPAVVLVKVKAGIVFVIKLKSPTSIGVPEAVSVILLVDVPPNADPDPEKVTPLLVVVVTL
jgi:hypothetical protein